MTGGDKINLEISKIMSKIVKKKDNEK